MTRAKRDPRTLRLVAKDLRKRAKFWRGGVLSKSARIACDAHAAECDWWADELLQQARELEKKP